MSIFRRVAERLASSSCTSKTHRFTKDFAEKELALARLNIRAGLFLYSIIMK
jgi:hypothetical protein